MSDRIERMRALLEQSFAPCEIRIQDDSHLHAGHAGARGGAGHYRVEISSAAFSGCSPIAAHRKVYAALESMMGREIHALSIATRAPKS